MGFSGNVAQILLLRELLISFYGNELSIGIILANWLILEAIGSFFVGKRVERFKNKLSGFITLQLIFSLSFVLAVYASRIVKILLGTAVGEGVGLFPIFYSSFLILLPVSICHGALFTFGCKIYSMNRPPQPGSISIEKQDAANIGRVYIWEALGTVAGGVGLTYLLIPYLHSLQIALAVALLNLILCLALAGRFWQKRQILTNKFLGAASLILSALCVYLIFGPTADRIHWLSIEQQFRQQKVLHYQNSVYGNVCVTKRQGQYSFFVNGIPTITVPTPDITFAEEFAHLPLLSHPQPKDVLIISAGAGGLIKEILKHPIERLDYAELDPLLIKLVKKFPTALTEAELNDPRVNIQYIDGRLFLKKTPGEYDVVLVGLSNPQDLQINRLFTREFFFLVKKKLRPEGILAMGLPGSLTYLSRELKDLNRCILNTLKTIYPYIKVIPGDQANLYLASASKNISLIDSRQLSQRLNALNLKVRLFTPDYVQYRLHPRWLSWFLGALEGGTTRVNEDFKPRGVFYSLAYWNACFSPYLQWLFRWMEKIELKLFVILFSIIMLINLAVYKIKKPPKKSVIPLCIATTGLACMVFNLALIYAFQALYGYVFGWIGLLITACMAGIITGSLKMLSSLRRIKQDFRTFMKIELAIIIFAIVLPRIFILFSAYIDKPAVSFLLQVVILSFCFLSGVLTGAEFPLANKIYLADSPNLSRTAGLLYACDLFGGWLGAVVAGVVLLPVLGLTGTCIVVAMLKLSSLLFLC